MKFNLNISLSNISLQLLLLQRSKLDNFVIEEKYYQSVMVLSIIMKDPLSWTPSNNMLKKIIMISFQRLENVPKSVQTTGIILGVKCFVIRLSNMRLVKCPKSSEDVFEYLTLYSKRSLFLSVKKPMYSI